MKLNSAPTSAHDRVASGAVARRQKTSGEHYKNVILKIARCYGHLPRENRSEREMTQVIPLRGFPYEY
jgi:hypothetical protein